VPACFALLLAFTLGSLCATSFRDPGVIPRHRPPPPPVPVPVPMSMPAPAADSDDKDAPLPPHYPLAGPAAATATTATSTAVAAAAAASPILGLYEYHVNGHVVKTRFCPTCQLARAPRVHHCRSCDACVGTPSPPLAAAIA
jgi:palmitoyltransferase ZDHHC9/14/18